MRLAKTRWKLAHITSFPNDTTSWHMWSFDPTRVTRTRSGDFLLWVRRDFSSPVVLRSPSNDYDQAVLKLDLDCKAMRYKIQYSQFYLRNEPGDGGPGDDTWNEILPSTSDETAYKNICNQLKKKR